MGRPRQPVLVNHKGLCIDPSLPPRCGGFGTSYVDTFGAPPVNQAQAVWVTSAEKLRRSGGIVRETRIKREPVWRECGDRGRVVVSATDYRAGWEKLRQLQRELIDGLG